jgi:outer membrane immunogenic protein
MFKRTNIALSIACGALLTVSGGVFADDMYYGGNLAFIDYSESGVEDASVTALYGRVGTNWNENFSGELRVGLGIGDDTINVLGTDVDFELNHFLGAYVKGGAQVNEVFYPYAILGFTRGEVEASAFGFSVSESETDVSFGLGADFTISESLTFNVEYMNYLDKDDAELSGFALGFSSAF